MGILLKNYELSIWDQNQNNESKLAIIGSQEMITPARAQSPTLIRNINGTKTLTFSLYYEYIDETEGEIVRNPFCPLITNGRKLKLFWRKKWYEFEISNIEENSEEKKITYTGTDAFIKELSKRGFDIELNTELENNQGTIFELGDKVLEKSDWVIDKENSQVGPQVLEDTLVELKVSKKLTPTEKAVLNSNNILVISDPAIQIPEEKKIYGFYSNLYKKDKLFQFFYLENQNYTFDDEGQITNCPLYSIDGQTYAGALPEGIASSKITTYRGKRLIRTQKSYFDSVLNNYVKVYKDSLGQEVLGYMETEYLTENFVSNLVTNDKDYISNIGWYPCEEGVEISAISYPDSLEAVDLASNNQKINTSNFLKVNLSSLGNWSFYNTGFDDNKKIISNLKKGQEFVIRMKYGYSKNFPLVKLPEEISCKKNTNFPTSGFSVALCSYEYDENGFPTKLDKIFEANISDSSKAFTKNSKDNYFTAICKSKKQYSSTEMLEKNLGLFFKYDLTSSSNLKEKDIPNYNFYIEDCQVFELKSRQEGLSDSSLPEYYLPKENFDGQAKIKYSYFLANQNYQTKEDIKYLYQGYKEASYEKKYYENYTQIRTIEAKESNIFNLIQTLCETFECWADFLVEHDSNGYIKKDSKGKFIKKIVFKPYIGKENWSGFRRGINLKKINRTIDSNQIVTKTIVKPNSNEFAPNGFCTIAYADENPSGESFIYDFRFYEHKGLIDSNQLKKDLYGSSGLYNKLKTYNTQIDKLIEERTAASIALINAEKNKEVQSALVSELSTQIASIKKDFRIQSGYFYSDFLKFNESKKQEILQLSGVTESFISILRDLSLLEDAKRNLSSAKAEYTKQFKLYRSKSNSIDSITNSKNKLILDFETKYASFIQEGSWISEDYVDHNLYYMDAISIAATSSVPKISYNIEVIDISSLEEFFNYEIDLGDKTYVIDPEFFGYDIVSGLKTPKKEEVIISELTEHLEEPENNKVLVQNYKTQYDDLFQRITATTQQLQLNTGSYLRATKAFTNEGLDSSVAENAINNTSFALDNNTNTWSTTGFISVNTTNPTYALKIHNGAIFSTENSEADWNKIIDGRGINADYIYAGQLDAGKINIVSELKTSENQELQYALTMDKDGLSMYSYEDTKQLRVRLGKIVESVENVENDEVLSELYGLQLYNKEGKQTFRTDSDGNITMAGTIYAKDGKFSGSIFASSGRIGGWQIEEKNLYHYTEDQIDAVIATDDLDSSYEVNGFSSSDWRLLFGMTGNSGTFGVTSSGNLFANGVDIKDGNISFGDIFKITTNGGKDGAVTYGLNIELDPENEDKSIVIETDDRVIGIRERQKDENGNEVRDDSGNPVWTWKTILGDLTNATLGGEPLSKLGMTGYGLCTENGFFSGTIKASNGEIGGWEITEKGLRRAFTTYSPDGEKELEEVKYIENGIIIGGYSEGTEIRKFTLRGSKSLTSLYNTTFNFNLNSSQSLEKFDPDKQYELSNEKEPKVVSFNGFLSQGADEQTIKFKLNYSSFNIEKIEEIGENLFNISVDYLDGETVTNEPSVSISSSSYSIYYKDEYCLLEINQGIFSDFSNHTIPLDDIVTINIKINGAEIVVDSYYIYSSDKSLSYLAKENGYVIDEKGAPREFLCQILYGRTFDNTLSWDKQYVILSYIIICEALYAASLEAPKNEIFSVYKDRLKSFSITDTGKMQLRRNYRVYSEDNELEEGILIRTYAEEITDKNSSLANIPILSLVGVLDNSSLDEEKWSLESRPIKEGDVYKKTALEITKKVNVTGLSLESNWSFESDSESTKFYFTGKKDNSSIYSDLGTLENPWGSLYLNNNLYIGETPFCYRPGEEIKFQQETPFVGFLSDSRREIFFSIPINKPLVGINRIKLKGELEFRGIKKTEDGSGKYGYISNVVTGTNIIKIQEEDYDSSTGKYIIKSSDGNTTLPVLPIIQDSNILIRVGETNVNPKDTFNAENNSPIVVGANTEFSITFE